MAFEYEPTKKARQLMYKYGTHDPYRLSKDLGYLLLYSNLGEDTYAERDTFKRITVITLNNQINACWQRFVLSHEIGHAVLHKGFSTVFYRNSPSSGMINWAEVEANRFAMQLMEANFEKEDLDQMTDYQIIDSMGLDDYNLIAYLH